MNRILIRTTVLALSLVGGTATAQTVQVPHTFEAGTPARAEEVNQNFDAGAVAINDNAMRLDALEARDISVDCDNGESIQDAVDIAREGVTINVSGTCHESVLIQSDHLHIVGNNVATIMPPAGTTAFRVVSTDNVAIDGFNILGGAGGVGIFNGSSAYIRENQIHDSTSVGILISSSSYAAVRDNSLHSTSGNFAQVFVSDSSHANVFDNTITASSGNGIDARSASSVMAGGNTVSGTAGFGMSVQQNSHMTLQNTNTVNTIFCGVSGSLEVVEVQIITVAASLDPGCDLSNFSGVPFP